ncbi:MAG: anaerobic ribonucleoside-triphosphate reductase activating protein [Oscillospiraceae bacterium]|nr:anaerobic ribonucleoside-triphosphate reductase activating protein [Oscillospiraceae bacterium]
MLLRISGTVNDSIVDGPGFRYTIFTQGCPHHCPGCQNPQTHAFEGGKVVSTSELLANIRKNPLLDGVTFSGGEPFCQAEALAELGREIKKLNLNIMTYTGFELEYLIKNQNQKNHYGDLLAVTDWLVDGEFIESKKSLNLLFRGSSNQRILDLHKSMTAHKPVTTNFGMDYA